MHFELTALQVTKHSELAKLLLQIAARINDLDDDEIIDGLAINIKQNGETSARFWHQPI